MNSRIPTRSDEVHWLDHVVAWRTRQTRRVLFANGWGDQEVLAALRADPPFAHALHTPSIEWSATREHANVLVRDGWFASPVRVLPAESRVCSVRWLLPREPSLSTPVYVVLAASGDEGFETRTRLWLPAVQQHGISVMLPENGLYGARRPFGQRGTGVRTVSEHLAMNIAMVLEARSLLQWLAHKHIATRGVAGFSMGASMAAVTAAVSDDVHAVTVLAAGRSASPVFTNSLLSSSVDFASLARDGGTTESKARDTLWELFAYADLDRFRTPSHVRSIGILGATRDGYVPASEIRALQRVWSVPNVRWIDTGHAGAIVWHAEALRETAVQTLFAARRGR